MRTFKGTVHVDHRTDKNLLPLTVPETAQLLDLKVFRRAKSDDEIEELTKAFRATHALLHGNEKPDKDTFRGSAASESSYDRSAFTVTKAKGFTQYRGGVQTPSGLSTDLTRVVPNTLEWETRLQRVYKGLDDVKSRIVAGTATADLDRAFRAHLDDTDVVYGRCIHDSGYEANEGTHESLQEYDFVTVGAAVGDGKETALVYRGAVSVPCAPTPSPVESLATATPTSSSSPESSEQANDKEEAYRNAVAFFDSLIK